MMNSSFLLPTTVSRSSQSQLHEQQCLLSKTACHVSYTVTFISLSREKLSRWEEGKKKVKVDRAWFRVPVVRRMKTRTKRRSFYSESLDTGLGHLHGSSSQEIRCLLSPHLHPSRGRQKSCFAVPPQRQRSMIAFQLQDREIYPKPLTELSPNQIVFIVQEGAR